MRAEIKIDEEQFENVMVRLYKLHESILDLNLVIENLGDLLNESLQALISATVVVSNDESLRLQKRIAEEGPEYGESRVTNVHES
jgi:hypothetical protein